MMMKLEMKRIKIYDVPLRPNQLFRKRKKEFRWRDRHGNFHKPSEMNTRHLYFTLRMIWNHVAPPKLKIHPYQKYRFSIFYTQEYMIDAIKHLSLELKKRGKTIKYINYKLLLKENEPKKIQKTHKKRIRETV